MADMDYYRVLGVSPSATGKQIKSAYRRLVKKYHPDLFATPEDKARATARFHQINRAYAVLGDAKRRSYYDEIRPQNAANVKPGPAAAARRSNPARQPVAKPGTLLWRSVVQSLAQVRVSARIVFSVKPAAARLTKSVNQLAARISHAAFTRPPLHKAAFIFGSFAVIWVLISLWKKPDAATSWALLENTVVEPLRPISPSFHEPNWTIVAYHPSRSHCGTALKERVNVDEQQGAKAFFDQLDGLAAITVRVKTEAVLAEEYFQAKLRRSPPSAVDPRLLREQAQHEASEFVRNNGVAQRVRKVQCREVVLPKSESWFWRMMKQAGLSS